jgi:demethylmenaquinone methyltransferase/2-methoxy-6-polyprenyl-1,4-benzoquinol methylase
MSDGPGVPTTEKVRGVFARIARRYDRMNSIISLGLHHSWRRRLVAEAALTPGCEVLDVASGTGDVALEIARTGLPARVVATDFVAEMLDIAKVKSAAYSGPTELTFEIQDGQALTFADGAFDVVTVSFGIRNMPDRTAGFREAYRVLRSGGRYLILEFTAPRSALFRPLFRFYTGSIVPWLGGRGLRECALGTDALRRC